VTLKLEGVEDELHSRDYESQGAKIRAYDIVANSIVNLRGGQRFMAGTPSIPGRGGVLYAAGATSV
jgi:hypothetical protein